MGMPVIPDLNAFGAAPGERVFRDGVIAREAGTSRTALAGALAALLLLCVPLAILSFNALLGACGDLLRTNVAAPLTALWGVAVAYVLAVRPWLPLAAALGALLAWLRRVGSRRGYLLVLPMGPAQQMQFGVQSTLPILLVPAALWVLARRLEGTVQVDVTTIILAAFPLWLLSGVAVDVAWESATARLLRRLAPLPPALIMSMAVHELMRMERDLETAKVRDVAAEPRTGTVHIRGQFEDAEQMRRAQQLCQKVDGVKSVLVTLVGADEHAASDDD